MHEFQKDLDLINSIDVVPTILDVVCQTTGMGFAAVARVTEERWIACNVRDDIGFGLKPGGELKIETTICHEIRMQEEAVVINHVDQDERYRDHHTPRMYGFQSYISMPIFLPGRKFYGTLCAIDPKPAQIKSSHIVGMFKMFAELIAFHIEASEKAAHTEVRLLEEQQRAELREQFIAILGHDLRTPLSAIATGAHLLKESASDHRVSRIAQMMKGSVATMTELIENVMNFAQGKLGSGIPLTRTNTSTLPGRLSQVVDELRAISPNHSIETDFDLEGEISCDENRIAQLLTNLLGNAIKHGRENHPVRVKASHADGIFELSVANAADPIPPAKMGKLFQPFYRVNEDKRQQGLGLGLYIVSEIAKAHDGSVKVSSTEEQTEFIFIMNSPAHSAS